MRDDEAAVEPHEADTMNQMLDQPEVEQTQDSPPIDHEQQAYEKTMVPLSALQKVKEKKRELELQLQWEQQERQRMSQAAQKPQEEDNSRFESATREELSRSQEDTIRMVEERIWIRQNPEKYEMITERLPTFLKQRPNLTSAIQAAPNRYEEAFTLMEALTPRQQQQLRKDSVGKQQPPKKEAPHSPGTVPKATAMNDAVDVMTMSDAEFTQWRAAQKRRR